MMTYCPWDVTIQKKINGGKKKKIIDGILAIFRVAKFNTIRQYDTNSTYFSWVWIEYK